jgi:hypothetical protein
MIVAIPHKLSTAIIYVNGIVYWVCKLERAPSLIPLSHVPCYNAKTLSWCSMPYTTAEVRSPIHRKWSAHHCAHIFMVCFVLVLQYVCLFVKLVCSALVLTGQRNLQDYIFIPSRRATGWMDTDLVNILFCITYCQYQSMFVLMIIWFPSKRATLQWRLSYIFFGHKIKISKLYIRIIKSELYKCFSLRILDIFLVILLFVDNNLK